MRLAVRLSPCQQVCRVIQCLRRVWRVRATVAKTAHRRILCRHAVLLRRGSTPTVCQNCDQFVINARASIGGVSGALRRQRRIELLRGVDDPGLIVEQRRDAGEAAAALVVARGRRPADHADHRPPPSPSKAGPPESPVQPPRPMRSSRVAASCNRICSEPGLPGDGELRHARNAEAGIGESAGDAEAGDGQAFRRRRRGALRRAWPARQCRAGAMRASAARRRRWRGRGIGRHAEARMQALPTRP